MKKVAIYSTRTCVYCKDAKDLFEKYKIVYDEYNVGTDLDRRREMVERSGQKGVPVIIIDDEVIVGFDEPRLKKALEIK